MTEALARNILRAADAIGPVCLATAGRRAAALGKALVVMDLIGHDTAHGTRPDLDWVYVHTHSTDVPDVCDSAAEQELMSMLSLAAGGTRDNDGDI
eukprot:1079169-Prymnesium_polylepis.1